MSRQFCVTIDVEPDCGIDWYRSNPLTFTNIETGIAEILHPLFVAHHVRPTYLISPEVLNHPGSVEVFKRLDQCELGAHLHSEYIEPHLKYDNAAGTVSHEYPCSLPDEVEQKKIEAITDLFARCFGYPPKSYRAARFGADEKTADFLAQIGYRVDTSVTPGIDWRPKGGPNFTGMPNQPYWLRGRDLLEVPVTIRNKRFPGLPNKWFCYRWLRPSIMTIWEMKQLIKSLVDGTSNVVLNMMFHSMEIMPKASPYVRTARGQKQFIHKLETVFNTLQKFNFESKTLLEIYDGWA